MRSFEERLRDALIRTETHGAGANLSPCPNAETWVLFLQGDLLPATRATLLEHLSRCSRCREILTLEGSAEAEAEQAAAAAAHAAAPGHLAPALPAPDSSFDLVLAWMRERVRILHRGLRVATPPACRPALAPVRSGLATTRAAASVRAEKQLGPCRAEFEIVPAAGRHWDVRVFLTIAEPRPEKTVLRVSLQDRPRRKELRSVVARQGTAVFQRLPSGDYGIEVRRTGSPLGALYVRLRSDSEPR